MQVKSSLRSILRRGPDGEAPEIIPVRETCLACGADLEGSRSYERYRVCHACGFHFHLSARERIALLLDPGTFHEDDRGVTAIDPLQFEGRHAYRTRVIDAQRRTGLTESALTGTGAIMGREVVVAVLEFSFLGGSIGVVAGERLARAFERATSRKTAIVTVCSTSGTRMQEGLLALMQLPRIAVAANAHARAGLPHVSIVTDPTTGSAYTGFVNLADYVFAEPNALTGYSALRVLEESSGGDLPEGAHTSENHASHGLIDAVVPRTALRDQLALLLDMMFDDYRLSARHEDRRTKAEHTPHAAWQQVQLSRHAQRPTTAELIRLMTSSYLELQGDRSGTDDHAVTAGFASMGGEAMVVIGQVRPKSAAAGAGWIGPAGFRKARRAMALAAKFDLPLVTLIDTEGASPELSAEQAGLGDAIARCLSTMLDVPSPTVAVITGEGNSEAAVAMAAADRVLMLDNAVYEVVRPEDAAAALYGEAERAGEVAERLRLTSHDCLRMGIIDATVAEPGEGAHTNPAEAANLLRRAILRHLVALRRQRPRQRLQLRYARYRQLGSTRSRLRGTLERRLAHVMDRIGALFERRNRRPRDGGDWPGIPV